MSGTKPALASDQLAIRAHDDRLQESKVGDAGGELVDIAQVAAVPVADSDFGNRSILQGGTHGARPSRFKSAAVTWAKDSQLASWVFVL